MIGARMFVRFLVAAKVAAAFIAPGPLHAQISIEDVVTPGKPPAIIAHRAVVGGAPENSLAGIQNAIDRGIAMVEVDVRTTLDDRYILLHDANLTRTTNVKEVYPDGAPLLDPDDSFAWQHSVSDYKLDDIERLRLLDPTGVDHPVPTLEAALSLAEGRVIVILDLKDWETETLVPVLESYDNRNLLLFTLGDEQKLSETAAASNLGVFSTLTGLTDVDLGFERALEIFGTQLKMVDLVSKKLTPEFLAKAKEVGVWVSLAGDRFEDYRLSSGDSEPWLAALQSDAVAFWTAKPDELLELLER